MYIATSTRYAFETLGLRDKVWEKASSHIDVGAYPDLGGMFPSPLQTYNILSGLTWMPRSSKQTALNLQLQ